MSDIPNSAKLRELRSKLSKLRGEFTNLAWLNKSNSNFKNTLKDYEGSMTIMVIALYHEIEDELKREDDRARNDINTIQIPFHPRGMGNNWIPCLICKEDDNKLRNDCASFVSSKDDANHAVRMFDDCGYHAVADLRRESENRFQVKLGACEMHKPLLEAIMRAAAIRQRISRNIIRDAVNEFKKAEEEA